MKQKPITGIDRINNPTQKEHALSKSNLTRLAYMAVIFKQLHKKKTVDSRDEQGNVITIEIDDDVAQRWAVDKLTAIFGDNVNNLQAQVKMTHTVEELWDIFEKAKANRVGSLN